MGVLLIKRKESLAIAEIKVIELETQIAKLCIKLPQKYNRYGTGRAYELVSEVMDNLTKGNSLYFAKTHMENYQARQNYFNKAIELLHCLENHITFLCELADPNFINSQECNKNSSNKTVETKEETKKTKTVRIKPKDWYRCSNLINESMVYVKKLKDSDTTRLNSFLQDKS